MSDSLVPRVTHRDPKGLKFMSIVETAYDKAGLTEEEAQHINDASGLAKLLRDFIAENRSGRKFTNDEVPSDYGYYSGYRHPKPIEEQIAILMGLYPGLDIGHMVPKADLPDGSEGYFAIPKWQSICTQYGDAVRGVLSRLTKLYGGSIRTDQMLRYGTQWFRQTKQSEIAWARISDQPFRHNILVVPAQFGRRHRGRSAAYVNKLLEDGPEFSLGAFAVGIMLLTHPERLQDRRDLKIDCAGDECRQPGDFAGHAFDRLPRFGHDAHLLSFGITWPEVVLSTNGTATAWGVAP